MTGPFLSEGGPDGVPAPPNQYGETPGIPPGAPWSEVPSQNYRRPWTVADELALRRLIQPNVTGPHSRDYSIKAPSIGLGVLGASGSPIMAVDSVRELVHEGWQPRTLFVGPQMSAQHNPDAPTAGAITWEIRGQHPGGWWFRRFSTELGDQVVIPIETFDDVAVKIIGATLLGVNAGVVVTDAPAWSGRQSTAWLATTVQGPGEFLVPYGADLVTFGTADAGFAWRTAGAGVVSVDTANPAVLGAQVTRKGSRYVTTVAGAFSAVWEIHL